MKTLLILCGMVVWGAVVQLNPTLPEKPHLTADDLNRCVMHEWEKAHVKN